MTKMIFASLLALSLLAPHAHARDEDIGAGSAASTWQYAVTSRASDRFRISDSQNARADRVGLPAYVVAEQRVAAPGMQAPAASGSLSLRALPARANLCADELASLNNRVGSLRAQSL